MMITCDGFTIVTMGDRRIRSPGIVDGNSESEEPSDNPVEGAALRLRLEDSEIDVDGTLPAFTFVRQLATTVR